MYFALISFEFFYFRSQNIPVKIIKIKDQKLPTNEHHKTNGCLSLNGSTSNGEVSSAAVGDKKTTDNRLYDLAYIGQDIFIKDIPASNLQ